MTVCLFCRAEMDNPQSGCWCFNVLPPRGDSFGALGIVAIESDGIVEIVDAIQED